jgi:hypothetical protein
VLDFLMATGTPSDPAMGRRYWIGLFNQPTSLGTLASGAAPTTHFAAFRADSVLGDTTWKGVVRNAGAIEVVDTGVALTNNTEYRLTTRVNANGTITFQVNGAGNAIASTQVPAASTLLWPIGTAIKDATGLAQILTWYAQRVIVRAGVPSKFR